MQSLVCCSILKLFTGWEFSQQQIKIFLVSHTIFCKKCWLCYWLWSLLFKKLLIHPFQIERRRKVRQTTNRAEKSVANSSTSSFSIISSSVEKQWSSNNEIIPKHSGKGLANNGKATQSYPSDVSLKLNVPYDAATSQATGNSICHFV